MKRIHTQAKKARRSSWFSKPHGKTMSAEREMKREDLQPRKPSTFGKQVHHVQTIVKDIYVGKRLKIVTKVIPHAAI